ncbi:hypothetical protein ACWGE1_24335 [Streptomyces sp. NPDC054932]
MSRALEKWEIPDSASEHLFRAGWGGSGCRVGEVKADRTVTVTGDLTTLGMLRVQGESRLQGKVNAGAHLSVRNADTWIMHTNDGKVAVNGDLSVHGAFRSDS